MVPHYIKLQNLFQLRDGHQRRLLESPIISILYDAKKLTVIAHGMPPAVERCYNAVWPGYWGTESQTDLYLIKSDQWDVDLLNRMISSAAGLYASHQAYLGNMRAEGVSHDAQQTTFVDGRLFSIPGKEGVEYGEGESVFDVQVTLDCTASRQILVRADNAEDASQCALRVVVEEQGALFEMNEGNYVRADDVHVTGVEEIEDEGEADMPTPA